MTTVSFRQFHSIQDDRQIRRLIESFEQIVGSIFRKSLRKISQKLIFLANFSKIGSISVVGRVRSLGSFAIRSRFSGGGGDRECAGDARTGQ